ncbi:hypothetical protein C8J56DRAFT_1060186 [Mycena floridula]|nr:hypothetical protein C8J56DRAFT_1060186 [Mycena floridula]
MSKMEITAQNNNIGSIGGDAWCHNTVTINQIFPKSTPGRVRGYMPAASDKLFGRDQEIEEIVRILTTLPASTQSKLSRLVLLGAGGQGKTATALKVMAHLAIKKFYPSKNSVWVPCEEASSPGLLLDVLFTSLDITKDMNNTIQDILNELESSSDPIILLLDNFETPWNAPVWP